MKIYTTEEARKKLGEILTKASHGENSLVSYHGMIIAMIGPPPPTVFLYSEDSGTAIEDHHH